MTIFSTIANVLKDIKKTLDTTKQPSKLKVALLYASNTTGKTRLSKLFCEKYPENVLCYNAFMEDLFSWDNENVVLKIDRNSYLAKLIDDEGLRSILRTTFSLSQLNKSSIKAL